MNRYTPTNRFAQPVGLYFIFVDSLAPTWRKIDFQFYVRHRPMLLAFYCMWLISWIFLVIGRYFRKFGRTLNPLKTENESDVTKYTSCPTMGVSTCNAFVAKSEQYILKWFLRNVPWRTETSEFRDPIGVFFHYVLAVSRWGIMGRSTVCILPDKSRYRTVIPTI